MEAIGGPPLRGRETQISVQENIVFSSANIRPHLPRRVRLSYKQTGLLSVPRVPLSLLQSDKMTQIIYALFLHPCLSTWTRALLTYVSDCCVAFKKSTCCWIGKWGLSYVTRDLYVVHGTYFIQLKICFSRPNAYMVGDVFLASRRDIINKWNSCFGRSLGLTLN